MSISSSCENFKDSVVDGKESNIKGTTPEIKDENILLLVTFVQAICNGSCRRLIDNTFNRKPSNLPCVFGCLTLSIIEVSRHSHHRMSHCLPQKRLRSLLHLSQNHTRYLLRRELLHRPLSIDIINLNRWLGTLIPHNLKWHELLICLHSNIVDLSSNKTLHVKDCIGGVLSSLVLCSIADETGTTVVGLEGDVGGGDTVA
mmetsp:Transcript_4850/g.10724  ORF Transcript_4850/g.10724 Transcript_4850/m.10724 type:complete len:201 (+) Transcript_4850:1371-1973(+)